MPDLVEGSDGVTVYQVLLIFQLQGEVISLQLCSIGRVVSYHTLDESCFEIAGKDK